MANKMLIDAAHPEETRVVTVKGSKVEEFDFESASRRQLRGNIYLAKVTRVEPSLQAAFVEYGGNRHGFLAFSEIHPDYYQIPIADRLALLEEDARAEREHAERPERNGDEGQNRRRRRRGRRAEAAAAKPDPVVSAPAEGLEPDEGENPAAETASESAGAVLSWPEQAEADAARSEAASGDEAVAQDSAPAAEPAGEAAVAASGTDEAASGTAEAAPESAAAAPQGAAVAPEDAALAPVAAESGPAPAPQADAAWRATHSPSRVSCPP
jgi:ribonuclease E